MATYITISIARSQAIKDIRIFRHVIPIAMTEVYALSVPTVLYLRQTKSRERWGSRLQGDNIVKILLSVVQAMAATD